MTVYLGFVDPPYDSNLGDQLVAHGTNVGMVRRSVEEGLRPHVRFHDAVPARSISVEEQIRRINTGTVTSWITWDAKPATVELDTYGHILEVLDNGEVQASTCGIVDLGEHVWRFEWSEPRPAMP